MAEQNTTRTEMKTFLPSGPGFVFREKIRAKNPRGTFRRLWQYLQDQTIGLILVAVFVTTTTIFDLFGPYLLGKSIDQHMLKGDIPGLLRISLILLAVYSGGALTGWIQTYIMAGVAQKTVMEMRKDLFAKLQTLSLRFFDKQPHGELMSRISNDIDNISNVLNESVMQFVTGVLTVSGVAVVMCMINVKMAVVSLITVPMMVLLTKTISTHTRKGFRDQQTSLGKLNGIIEETIAGERVVQAFGQEPAAMEKFEKANLQLKTAATRAQSFMIILGPIGGFLNNISFIVVACAGGFFVISGAASVGNIASFIGYARLFSRPLSQIANLYNTVQSAIAGAERVFQIIDEVPEHIDKVDAKPLRAIKGDVIFENVTFGYENKYPVLKNINIHAKPGQTIAFVGPTGAGKTTVVNLLTRFYDIDQGGIYIDGNSISEVQKDSLRSQLGIVLQDTYLFSETVMENIRYGKLEASDADVIEAAKLADAHSFIERLPHGYATQLSERGGNLSQGQRQLLAIARAILADPAILILDEATSSVDTRTEMNIQKALLNLMKGRTSFVIAHRLSTIREADEVLVINGGMIIERGTHEDLLALGGFYDNMYRSQFKGQEVMELENN
jgi:ATP-binding cassette subfamily B protein